MPKYDKLAGITSEIWPFVIQDSSKTDGSGLIAIAYNTSGLTCYYHRNTAASAVAVTLVDMTVGSYTSGGLKKISDANMPGSYQFCPPDAALAAGAKSVLFEIFGAANMAPVWFEVQLTAVNPDSATAFMTGVNSLAPPTNWNLLAIDTSGRINAFLIGILTSVFTEGATGRIAAAFKQFFNIASPAATMDHGVLVDTATTVTNAVSITSNIKKNQALSKFVFQMTDSTNHLPATGKTVSVTRSIDGAAFAAGTLSSVTELSDGDYYVDWAAADLNGNVIVLKATATGCDTTEERIITQP